MPSEQLHIPPPLMGTGSELSLFGRQSVGALVPVEGGNSAQ